MQLIRHGHWWRDDGGWGGFARNDGWDGADGWDSAGGGGSDRQMSVGGGRKLTTGKFVMFCTNINY